mgnify:CR=1 FL=1
MNKSEIRKKILKIRKQKSSKSLNINFEYLLKILKKKKDIGKVIGGYYPYNYEVEVIEILINLEKQNYQISLPKIKKNSQMDFFCWSSQDPLQINKYGIPEPASGKKIVPNILLVPLVAFDKNCNRIGYGGGYYDRYLQKIEKKKKILSIGFAFSFQEINKVNRNKFDKKLDYILTNKSLI